MTYQPCEKHEVWPCGICNGDDARLRESLEESVQGGVLLAPGVVTASHLGHCARCGQNFGVGSPIRFDDAANGWIALACCG